MKYKKIKECYSLAKSLKCVKVDGFFRVSFMLGFIYVDQRSPEYLVSKKWVSVLKIILDLGASLSRAKGYVSKLLSAGMIQA